MSLILNDFSPIYHIITMYIYLQIPTNFDNLKLCFGIALKVFSSAEIPFTISRAHTTYLKICIVALI